MIPDDFIGKTIRRSTVADVLQFIRTSRACESLRGAAMRDFSPQDAVVLLENLNPLIYYQHR